MTKITPAAAGEAILNLMFHQRQLPLPKWLIVVHATAAVVGFALLAKATFFTPAL